MKSFHFAALVASASAIGLNSEIYPHPDYYADGYSNTWKYTDMPHIVNETAYVNDVPTTTSDPWLYDEGAFAGSTASDNALVQEDDETLLYLKEQHKAAHNQQVLEQIMLEEWNWYPSIFRWKLRNE